MKQDCFSLAPPIIKEFLGYMGTVKGKSPLTVEEYFMDLRTFFRYMKQHRNQVPQDMPFDEISIDDIDLEFIKTITLTDVYEYMNFVSTQRKNKATTRSRKVSSLRTYFQYLTNKVNKLEHNPITELETPKTKKSLPKYLTLEQSMDLLNAVEGPYQSRDYCIITLFLNCGMRLTELVTINMGDFKQDTIRITGKGNKERLVYLKDACLEALDHYKKARAALPNLPADERALFVSKRTGKRLTARRVEQIVARCLQSAGLSGRGFSPHKLRHTAATLMYQGGVDMLALKEILGHESVSTTQIYTHINQERLRAAVKASPLADQGYIAESKPSQQDSGEED